jgi:hypothetical protein
MAVFQHTQIDAMAARVGAKLDHVSDRDAAVFRHHQRLRLCGKSCHFGNDCFFFTAIQTQGLLLQNVLSGCPFNTPLLQRPDCQEINSFQRDRHLRWLVN